MKKQFFLIMSACLCSLVMGAAKGGLENFDPGGVSVDLSQRRVEKTAIIGENVITFGDFEDESVDLKQSAAGQWGSNFQLHVSGHDQELKALTPQVRALTTQGIETENPASGKRCVALITPLSVNEFRNDQGVPMVSNRIFQNVVFPEALSQIKYRLSFQLRGELENVAGLNSFIVFVESYDQPKVKRDTKLLDSFQTRLTPAADWREHTIDFIVPEGTRLMRMALALYGCGEAYIDHVQLQQVQLEEGLTVKLMPFAFLDQTFCLGSGQPGTLVFAFRNENETALNAPVLYLKVPEAFELIDVRNMFKLHSQTNDHQGNRIYAVNVGSIKKLISRDAYSPGLSASIMLKTDLPPSETTYASEYWIEDGSYRSYPERFDLKVLPASSGKTPQMFRSATMLSRESSFEGDGAAAFVDFYAGNGFNCVYGASTKPLFQGFKQAGISRYTQPYHLCNGYRLGHFPKPEEARFRLVDGSPYQTPHEGICPVEVYKQGDYYQEHVAGMLRKFLIEDDLVENVMPNWEPYMFNFKGCFCVRCKEEFVRYSQLPSEEIDEKWPESIIAAYRDTWIKFRSWQHGMMVETIENTVREIGKEVGKESHFIPAVGWNCFVADGECPQYASIDYLDKIPWIEVWGPYISQKILQPHYRYNTGEHLRTYYAARAVKKFVADRTPDLKKRPKLIAYPHSYQGKDWVTEPEALSFEYLCFFLNGWEGAFAYVFPNGYDHRYWSELADVNTVISEYEHYVYTGKQTDSVTVTAETPLPSANFPISSLHQLLPGIDEASVLQSVSYRLDRNLMAAVGNFWIKGEVFFKLKVNDLAADQKYVLTEPGRNRCYANAHGAIALTAEELKNGITLHVGALRWNVYVLEPYEVGGHYGDVVTPDAVKKTLKTRLPVIEAALQDEQAVLSAQQAKAEKDLGMPDYSQIKSMDHLGVSCQARKDGGKTVVAFEAGSMTFLLDPSAGGRLKSWTKDDEELVSQDETLGLGVDAFWWPKEAACLISTPYQVVDQFKTSRGLGLTLERQLTQKDNLYLEGFIIRKTYDIHEEGFELRSEIMNPTKKTLPFVFRWHNMLRLFEIKDGEGGQASLKNQSETKTFPRSFIQKLYRFSTTQEKDLEVAFRMDQTETVTEPRVLFTAPWSQKKVTAAVTTPEDLYSFLFWDSGNQKTSTFEPLFKKTVLEPGAKWSASMTWSVD